MSSGGISYSGITNYGVVTLPATGGWNTNNNILRDPSKSITTRRIDKVGDNNNLISDVDQSGDRICESINKYARGVNPFVSVDYSNNGSNGGQNYKTSNPFSNTKGTSMPYLPYRVAKDGAFRPPILTQSQLMPLSRQPRTNTSAFTKKGFADYSKTLFKNSCDFRSIKEEVLQAEIRPTATYNIQTQIDEPYDIKNYITEGTKFDSYAGNSGVRTMDLTTTDVKTPLKEIIEESLNPENVNTNSGSSGTVVYNINTEINRDKYIQDTIHSFVETKRTKNINTKSLEELINVDIQTKDLYNISYTPIKTGYTNEEFITKDVNLNRTVLKGPQVTNKGLNIYKRPEYVNQIIKKNNRPNANTVTNSGSNNMGSFVDHNARDYKLKYTVSPGGMSGRGTKPRNNQNSEIHIPENNRYKMNKNVSRLSNRQ